MIKYKLFINFNGQLCNAFHSGLFDMPKDYEFKSPEDALTHVKTWVSLGDILYSKYEFIVLPVFKINQ